MTRPEQAEWTETVESQAEDSAGATAAEKSPDPAPSGGEGTIAHRLNRVTRYASAAGTSGSPEPAPPSDPTAQPAAGSPEPDSQGPAPAGEPAPVTKAPPEPTPTAPPEAETPPAEPLQAPSSSEPSRHEPASAMDAAPGEAPRPDGPASAPVETRVAANAEAGATVAAPEPGPAMAEAAEPAPASDAHPTPTAEQAAPAHAQAAPAPAATQTPSAPSPAATDSPEPAMADGEVLTVGRGIRLVAKLCECAELLVEGHLEATARARHLVVAQGGRFIGSAEVDTAEIHGHFEGNLTVAKRLLIPATGSVAGTTCYQEIVIEAGGRIMGNTQRLSEPAAPGDSAA